MLTIVSILKQVVALSIEDCWVGAGVIRNAIWNHLHGRSVDLLLDTDVDVAYWILVTPTPEGTSPPKSSYSRNTPIFPGQCTIKRACMNVTATRRIATPKTRSDADRKRRRQLPHAAVAPV